MELIRAALMLVFALAAVCYPAAAARTKKPVVPASMALRARNPGREDPGAAALVSGVAATSPASAPPDFFKSDYPNDSKRKQVKHTFSQPFPVVQDTEDFAKDYVKDENGDGGEWKAQTEYDKLRTMVNKQKEEMAGARAKEQAAKRQLEDAQQKAGAAANEADVAAAKAKGMRVRVKDDEVQRDKVSKEVVEAEATVSRAVTNFEECKKRLAEAQEKLKQQQAKEDEETEEDEKEDRPAAKVGKAKAKSGAEKITDADEAVATAKVHSKRVQAAVAKKRDEHDDAAKRYEKELAEVERAEAELKQAAEKLRRFRHPGQPEPQPQPQQSGATSPAASNPVVIAAVAVAIVASLGP